MSKMDMSDPESVMQATKKGKTLMMFVSVANKPKRARTEELTKIWQTSLWSNHIQAERYFYFSASMLYIKIMCDKNIYYTTQPNVVNKSNLYRHCINKNITIKWLEMQNVL